MAGSFELGFLGAGNMAEGIVAAVLGRGLYRPEQVIVSDPVTERRELFTGRFHTRVTADNSDVVTGSRRTVWSIKPQSFSEVAASLSGMVRADHLHISIMAGLSTRRLESAFPGIKARLVRVMPNLPIKVGAGMAGLYAGQYATPADLAEIKAIFDAGGGTVVLDDESLMDALTAVSGSGPAYFYYFVEAMVAGGVACGLAEADALKLAEYACLGAARMMLESGESPAELRRRVTSKGGTTQAALECMEKGGVGAAVRDAVLAAFHRGQQMGAG